MHANRFFQVLVMGALAVMAVLTLRQALAATDIVAGEPDDQLTTLDQAQGPAGQNVLVRPRPYRASLDECFDVPLKDAGACRGRTQTYAPPAPVPTPEYRPALDECSDVPLKDAAACRAAAQAPTATPTAEPVDVCVDVALRDACDD